uniref:Diacylglycerol kinase catalytic region n=1 Tax=uncultured Verrucomicrobiota bacterium TaxID=156588 RepID=D2DXT9_9BACT|nr:diacylglycerol kinase catalytic region [uncultured Verrucomicrobiota bacterium]
MQDTLIILNPAARSEKARSTWKEIQKFASVTTRLTSAPGDARALAAWAVEKGFRAVVAAGGDGTINEVVNGLAGSDVTLGVLPVGTMNVFAAELGLPGDLKAAWQVVREGITRKVDLARANDQYFIQLAGVGLDAQALQETTWESKRSFGPLSYLVSAAQIAARVPPRLLVEAEGIEREGSFVLVGNGRYYGTRLAFFKDAKVDDGKLDVLIFKNLGYLDIARYLGTILMGIHTEQKDVEYFQTKRAIVRCDRPVPVEVDGEVATESPVTFRISSRKLRVFVPEEV